jgi:activator of HSP90 ATPase
MKTITQKIVLNGSAHEIYEMLMDSDKHAEFTGQEAKISREVGGKIEAFDGWVQGKNLELIPDKKIVQKWRGKDWEKDVWSKVTFVLNEKESKTELSLKHEDIPDDKVNSVDKGWREHYWDKIEKILG